MTYIQSWAYDAIQRVAQDNQLYIDNLEFRDGYYVVSICWGDWKHEHLKLDFLLQRLGFVEEGSIVTEEDGSDCYSADHYFIYPEE